MHQIREKGMKILVTGGAGFISSHIVDKLIIEGYKVICIDNLSSGKLENINPQADFYNIDICNAEVEQIFKKEKPEIVIHNAAQIDVQRSFAHPLDDANTNIIGSLNIFENSLRYGTKKLIYASSAAVYGEPIYLGIDEEHPVNPQSFYGSSKHSPEHYLKIMGSQYDFYYTILRLSNVYGPRQCTNGGVIPVFFKQLLKEKAPTIYGDGEQSRDFIYVMDVAAAYLKTIEQADSQIINISTNTATSLNCLYNMMLNITQLNISPAFEKEREGEILHSHLDNHKAQRLLRWKINYSIEEGLKETFKYYSTNLC